MERGREGIKALYPQQEATTTKEKEIQQQKKEVAKL